MKSAIYEKIKLVCCFSQSIIKLIKAFDFPKLINFVEVISNENELITRKVFLATKIFECCRFLYEIITIKLNIFNSMFISKTEFNEEEYEKQNYDSTEALLFSYFIECMKSLLLNWNLKVVSDNSLKMQRLKISQMEVLYKIFYKLYGTHQYLNNINKGFDLLKYNFVDEINDNKDKRLGKQLLELEKIISILEGTIKSRIDNNETSDNYSNEMVVGYASSVLQIAYSKKIMCFLAQFVMFKSLNALGEEDGEGEIYEEKDDGEKEKKGLNSRADKNKEKIKEDKRYKNERQNTKGSFSDNSF